MSDAQQETQSSNMKGCLIGCLIAFGIMVALLVAGSVGLYYFAKGQVEKYTSAEPMEITVQEYTPEKLAELRGRLDSFNDAVEAEESEATELVLTADDVNALIAENEDLKGKVFVRIEESQVSGDISLPLDDIPLPIPGKAGRYFNGSATLDATMDDGYLDVRMREMEVNGEALPKEFIDGVSRENLAGEMYKNPDQAKFLRQFDDIRIEGDKIYLKLKEKVKEEDSETESAADETKDTDAAEDSEADSSSETETSEDTEGTEAEDEKAAEPVA